MEFERRKNLPSFGLDYGEFMVCFTLSVYCRMSSEDTASSDDDLDFLSMTSRKSHDYRSISP